MILIAGAGPAGMAAAVRASASGASVTVLDDNPAAGGQIWRGGHHHGTKWFQELRNSGAEVVSGARIICGDAKRRCLTVESQSRALEIRYEKLILATGAREFFLPFPGWTLPNVMGVGGLQALVKSGLPIRGKRIVVAGTGPLLLAAAAFFREQGAVVPLIAEQTDWKRLARFGLRLLRYPEKLLQAGALRMALRGSRYLPSSWVEAAEGEERVISVRVRRGSGTWTERCDYLATGYGFKPNTELAALMGCQIGVAGVQVDEFQQTSMQDVYCAGECTGIGGVDLSLIEGEIAGHVAAGQPADARKLFGKRKAARRFAASLDRAFALRDELRGLASDNTIVCRCEDVTWERLRSAESWRAAKLHSRCGMGPCQGRICGPILEFLQGASPGSIRPPVFPARVESLMSFSDSEEKVST